MTEESLRDFRTALVLDPDYPSIYFHRGIAHILLYNTDESIDDLDRDIASDSHSFRTLYARSTARYLMCDFQLALVDADAAIESNPRNGNSYMLRCEIRRELENFQEARSDSIRAE